MRAIALSAFVIAAATAAHAAPLAAARRLDAHRAVERVLWAHRIWPESNPGPKPSLESVLPEAALRAQVDDVLRKSNALATLFKHRIGNRELQAEIDRMVRDSRDPALLSEMFDAVGRDPVLVGEVIARPALVDRLIRSWHGEGTFNAWWSKEGSRYSAVAIAPEAGEAPLTLPQSARSPATAACPDDTWTRVGTGAPSLRMNASAVWTGSEMIVWGGSFAGLNPGGRYNPATDTWSTLTTRDMPPMMTEGAAAVWTGTRMVVWGGRDDSGNYSQYGGRYDPLTDTWTTMSFNGAPSARAPSVGVWTGSVMIVWGIAAGDSGTPNSGGRYDPISDTWAPTSLIDAPPNSDGQRAVWTGTEMILWPGARYNPASDTWAAISMLGDPGFRRHHALVWTGSKMIVWGGLGGFFESLNTGGIYDPASNTWTTTTTFGAPAARSRHAYGFVSGLLVVWGGQDANGNDPSTGGRYDPVNDRWAPTTVTGAPPGRTEASWISTPTELIVWGGTLTVSGGYNPTSTGGRYNPITDAWVPTRNDPPSPTARSEHTGLWTGTEMIVFGGFGDDFQGHYDGAAYTPATDTWRTMADAPRPRDDHSAVWTGTEMIVWGGFDGTGYSATGDRYNPASNTWASVTMSNAPEARIAHTAVWTGTKMVVWGGQSIFGWMANAGGRYDPSSDSWLPVSTAGEPVPTRLHAAVWTGTAMIVWGGDDGHDWVSSGGRYNPVTDSWSATSAVNAPSPRRRIAGVWTGSRFLVWGGEANGVVSGGASYDPAGDTWSPISTVGAPSERTLMSATWTGSELIIWGGTDYISFFNTGARYFAENDSWRPISPGPAPSARHRHSGVWTGSRTVIWGGDDSRGIFNDGASYCSCVNWYPDADGDTYGEFGGAVSVCDGSRPAGMVGRYGDCNDGNPSVHPGAPDNSCNGVDDDCDGHTDEDYLPQPSVCGQGVCRSFGTLDCVNGQAVNSCVPGTPNSPVDDSCNTLDDDCDGSVDDDFPRYDDYWRAVANAPAARTNHTAVWSGSEMIVFGGDNGSATVQTGGYAYAWGANTWRALAAGPTKRWHHTAVWTGTRMIVWGGDDNVATIYNTGSRYDPGTDTWAATTTTNAPTARFSHSAVWTGTRMIVFGGHDATVYLNTGAQYDPTGNSWSAIATSGAPSVRAGHTAVWSGSEMIVWGGLTTGQAAVNTGGRYNPSSNSWTALPTSGAPSARYGHVAVWTGSEMLIWGGTTNGTTFLGDGARYNPATNTWASIPNLGAPTLRGFASFAWTGTELIVWGGMYRTNETPNTPLADGARYNPQSNSWTPMHAQITPPSARARAQAVWTGTELIVWGGDPVGAAQSTGGIYSPRTLCGIGGCQQVGLTYCSAATIGFQCTPGVPFTETCDNVDNDCDGFIDDNIPAPTTHPVVFGVKNGGNLMYWWVATPDTTAYDVVRGHLGTLRSSGGNFTTSLDTCLVNDIRTEAVTDNTAPGVGAGFWYLVRPVNLCSGLGTYDDTSPPPTGPRDA